MVRVLAAYSLTPYSKKNLKYSDIKLPIDREEDFSIEDVGELRILEKDSIRQEYEKAGFDVTDDFLESILSKKNGAKA